MNSIRDLYTELYNLPFPGGIASLDNALHAEITANAAHNIVQFVRYFYNDEKLNLNEIKFDEQLNQRLDRSIDVLMELRDFTKRHNELAELLISAISSQS